jgi:hypothetical protein
MLLARPAGDPVPPWSGWAAHLGAALPAEEEHSPYPVESPVR